MLKKLVGLIKSGKRTNKRSSNKRSALKIISRDEHSVSRKGISPSALKVLYRLNSSGYDAFLVGGGVRDLLLDQHPKDFDVATNATPEEVSDTFRNCRLIGRRFRLAHIRFGREIIEVATFRAGHQAAGNQIAQTSEDGQILRDNVYGNQEDDALRRDFTVNALYYSVKDYSIYDYTGGMKDLQEHTLRLIGDPETRYREDPVRMLRAVRFACKLDFKIAESTGNPIYELGPLLLNIPPARLFEEVLKLFLSGKALVTFTMLREFRLLPFLFPVTAESLDGNHPYPENIIKCALRNTDQRISQGKPVTPAFLYAALLWPALQKKQERIIEQGIPPMPALHKSANKVIDEQVKHTSLPRRFSQPMKEIWEMQLRLPRRHGKKAEILAEHPRFRAAYDFLLLREESGEDLKGLGDWWTQYQETNPIEGQNFTKTDDHPQRRKRPRRVPRRHPSGKRDAKPS